MPPNENGLYELKGMNLIQAQTMQQKYSHVNAVISKDKGVLFFEKVNYACAGDRAQVCQTLVGAVVNAHKEALKFNQVIINMPVEDAEMQCNCILGAMAQGSGKKNRWKVVVSNMMMNRFGEPAETLLYSTPKETTLLERLAFAKQFCRLRVDQYKGKNWRITRDAESAGCGPRGLCPVTTLNCPPGTMMQPLHTPLWDQCGLKNAGESESPCLCCVAPNDPYTCASSRQLRSIHPEEVVAEVEKHPFIVLSCLFLIMACALGGFALKLRTKEVRPRNKRSMFNHMVSQDDVDTFSSYGNGYAVAPSEPSRQKERPISSRRPILNLRTNENSGFQALIDDIQEKKGLEPIPMTEH